VARLTLFSFFLFSLLASCSSAELLSEKDASNRTAVSVPVSEILDDIPDYKNRLHRVSGKGRALVSEPGNSDRVTLVFEADRSLSLITVKNRIGIEGGKFLVDADSILIYDKLNEKAQKISIYDGKMTNLNELASVNILDILNYTPAPLKVNGVFQNDAYYVLTLDSGGEVLVDKKTGLVAQVTELPQSQLPYSTIIYEGYTEINGFTLPRKITIFSSDRKSKVAFLIQSLTVNPDDINLELKIPKHINILRP